MGDTAADGTGQGEASVERSAGGGNSGLSLDGGHDEIRDESGEGLVKKERKEAKKGTDHAINTTWKFFFYFFAHLSLSPSDSLSGEPGSQVIKCDVVPKAINRIIT